MRGTPHWVTNFMAAATRHLPPASRHLPPAAARSSSLQTLVTAPDPLPSGKPRRPLRPLHGIPEADRRTGLGLAVSSLLHLLILLALFLPPFLPDALDLPMSEGAGGPGPAGGGGGGNQGTGGERFRAERVRFMQVAKPAAPTPTPAPPIVTPPKPEPVPEPVVTPPEPTTPVAPPVEAPTAPAPSVVNGTGGGTGTDGTAGNGPGSGGGVGSGIGTGRGTGNGPGTGGGNGDVYPPQAITLALPPLPTPTRVKPYRLVAWFDVDERGNAKLIAWNRSKDGGYNRKILEMLTEVRFRPAVRPDGTPVRDTVSIIVNAPD